MPDIHGHTAADFDARIGAGHVARTGAVGLAGFHMLCRSRLCGVLRRRLVRSCRVGVRQRLVAGMGTAKCGTMPEEIGPGYRFHLRVPRFGGLEASKAADRA